MTLTDQELGYLEQITYLTKFVGDAAGVSNGIDGFKGITSEDNNLKLSEILSPFDDEALNNLRNMDDTEVPGTNMSGKEWAGYLEYMQDSQMKDLVLNNIYENDVESAKEKNKAYCFVDNNNPKEAIVTFRGTAGEKEWVDDVDGMNLADTEDQKEALEYIDNEIAPNFDTITVTGHSKGGNKAMYVSIHNDKITRCVSFDGQGFSREFLEKYPELIEKNAGKITAYALSTDYVHVLLYPIPGINHYYCEGYGQANFAENHCMNSFFAVDGNGKPILDKNGIPTFTFTEEDKAIKLIHKFINFFLNNASKDEINKVKVAIMEIMPLIFPNDISKQDFGLALQMLLENREVLVISISYLIKFIEIYDLDYSDIKRCLRHLGIITSETDLKTFAFIDIAIVLIEEIRKQIFDKTVNNGDKQFAFDLQMLKTILSSLGYDIPIEDVGSLFLEINNKVDSMEIKAGVEDLGIVSSSVTRDFSMNMYNTLIDIIDRVDDNQGFSLDSWNMFKNQEWYSEIHADIAKEAIETYFEGLHEINVNSKAEIDRVFENVHRVDHECALKLEIECENLRKIADGIKEIADNLNI